MHPTPLVLRRQRRPDPTLAHLPVPKPIGQDSDDSKMRHVHVQQSAQGSILGLHLSLPKHELLIISLELSSFGCLNVQKKKALPVGKLLLVMEQREGEKHAG